MEGAREVEDAPARRWLVPGPQLADRPRLFLLSAALLFTELLLIRWSAAHVVYLAFFTNFVLLASFLGIGVGFLRAGAPRDLSRLAPYALATFALFVGLFPVEVERAGERAFVGLFGMPALPVWVVLPVIFALATATTGLIAEGVARTFARLEALDAYRIDIAGAITGIVLFSAFAFLQAPPLVWAAVAAAGLWWTMAPLGRRAAIALLIFVLVLGVDHFVRGDEWSPYYRVDTRAVDGGTTAIHVNGLPHQSTIHVRRMYAEELFYLEPYALLPDNPLREVLIVGAGNGNDVAVALAQGAGHVDAVEIDPVILSIGRDRHPDRPYDDPRVEHHVDDGRAFLQRTDRRYDLVLFALPDSLTLVGGQGALRLESYLFTVEALQEIRAHLAPGGAFAMYNYYRADVFERFAETMRVAFGHAPCVVRGEDRVDVRDQGVLAVGLTPGDIVCGELMPAVNDVTVATDDHPFPYLGERRIPRFHLTALSLLLIASLVTVRWAGGPLRRMRPYADLFLMGVAFLLLETMYVVRFALLFGTTWFVNALVFAGVLLVVLAAIETARRVRLPSAVVLYALLGTAIALAWIIPQGTLLALAPAPRFVAAIALAFAPIYLANLVFAQRFRDTASSTVAFGANLLGAMVGGVVEYGALITGYRGLLVIVAIVYALAFVVQRKIAPATV